MNRVPALDDPDGELVNLTKHLRNLEHIRGNSIQRIGLLCEPTYKSVYPPKGIALMVEQRNTFPVKTPGYDRGEILN
jgi:hypothetical protein